MKIELPRVVPHLPQRILKKSITKDGVKISIFEDTYFVDDYAPIAVFYGTTINDVIYLANLFLKSFRVILKLDDDENIIARAMESNEF